MTLGISLSEELRTALDQFHNVDWTFEQEKTESWPAQHSPITREIRTPNPSQPNPTIPPYRQWPGA